MPIQYGGPGVAPSLGNLVTTTVALNSGEVWPIPSGRWGTKPGRFTSVQEFDWITGIWRAIGAGSTSAPLEVIFSDGTNYRLANQTGCPVGALVKTAGSGYSNTTPPTFTPNTGGSIWKAIVGGALNTSVTVSNGGTNYTYPPTVLIPPPPMGNGVPATAYCTLSGGAVSTVTIVDQGAGYLSPPTITFANDPREGTNGVGTGTGAAAVATLTGAGTVTAVLCLDHGQGGQTAPVTLTPSSGSAAVDVIMCFTITAYNVSSTTAGSGVATPVIMSAYGGFPSDASVLLNPTIQANLVKTRPAQLLGAVASGALTATGQTVNDGGVYPGVPTMYIQSPIVGTGAVIPVLLAPTVGGASDVSTVFAT